MTDEQKSRKRERERQRMAAKRASGPVKRYRGNPATEAARKARYHQRHKLHINHATEMRKATATKDEPLNEKRARLRARYLDRCSLAGIVPIEIHTSIAGGSTGPTGSA